MKKAIGFAILFATLAFKCELTIVIAGKVAGSLLSMIVNANPANRYLGYSFGEQIRDIFPAYAFSCVGLFAARAVPLFMTGGTASCYVVQAGMFFAAYLCAAVATHSRALAYLVDFCRPYFGGNRDKREG